MRPKLAPDAVTIRLSNDDIYEIVNGRVELYVSESADSRSLVPRMKWIDLEYLCEIVDAYRSQHPDVDHA